LPIATLHFDNFDLVSRLESVVGWLSAVTEACTA